LIRIYVTYNFQKDITKLYKKIFTLLDANI